MFKVTQNVDLYPLHYVTYEPTTFDVATSNGYEEDTITRDVTYGWMVRGTDDFGTKFIYVNGQQERVKVSFDDPCYTMTILSG